MDKSDKLYSFYNKVFRRCFIVLWLGKYFKGAFLVKHFYKTVKKFYTCLLCCFLYIAEY